MKSRSHLPQPRRFVTTHDSQGVGIFSDALPEEVDFWAVGPPDKPASFGLGYATCTNPVRLTNDVDLIDIRSLNERPKEMPLVQRGGSLVRYVDYPPKSSSPMHRTVSCDYAITLIGNMECRLDSGDSRVVRAGDVLVQRGTKHQWFNNSDSWARMLYVLLDATKVEVGGLSLGEDLGGMIGVRSGL